MIEIILGVIILLLVAECIAIQHQHAEVVDRLTDKVMARDYGDYQMGQAIKKDEREEGVRMPHTDESEAVIEEQRNQGLLKHIGEIDKQMSGMVP